MESVSLESVDRCGIKLWMKVKRQLNTGQAITRMVRRIARRFHPEKIILFGSHARGNAGPDSDVDLLVVMSSHMARREQQVQIRMALHDIPVPKDIIVVSPDELERRRHIVGTLEYPAAKEGRVLYGR